jgi:hypothetical protein
VTETIAALGDRMRCTRELPPRPTLPSPDIDELASGDHPRSRQITDPHNVGAILRSAAFGGVRRHALRRPEATGVLAKAPPVLWNVQMVTVPNLARHRYARIKTCLWSGLTVRRFDLATARARHSGLVLGAEGRPAN